MNVKLIAYTPNLEKVIACAASMCYSSAVNVDKLISDMEDEKQDKLVKMIVNNNHSSVLEHVSFTFAIEGVSRALLAEITRHRIGCSFSVRSQRYCSEGECEFIIPSTIKENKEKVYKKNGGAFFERVNHIYSDALATVQETYSNLINHGVPKEDARMILPNATHTRMIVTMNARALLHFFELRCCVQAQWEIRQLANEMLKLVKPLAPTIFANAGAFCKQYGYCPEKTRTCGAAPTMAALKESYNESRRKAWLSVVRTARKNY